MKLLLIVDRVDHPNAPNPRLAARVAAELARAGHTLHLLELTDGASAPLPAPWAQRRFALPFADEACMNRCLEYGNPGGSPAPVRLARLACHPAAALAAVRTLALHQPRRPAAVCRELERRDAAEAYDWMIALAAPFDGAMGLSRARLRAKKAAWCMDPYAIDHPADPTPAREQALYAGLDRIFITAVMARQLDQPGCVLAGARARTRVLEFPSLTPPPQTEPRPQGEWLDCLFAGSLYPTLRTPHYALALFAAMNLPQTRLHFIGPGWEQYAPDTAAAARAVLGQRLTIQGPVPPEEAAARMGQADVLLHLGNDNTTQVPSKLYEYFAAGKPVLALLKRRDDPAREPLARWPLACVVYEDEGTGPAVCARVAAFLRKTGRARLPWPRAAELFRANTPAAVAETLAAGLRTEEDP